MVELTINGRRVRADEGCTILRAAEENDIPIPHLCYLKGINEIAACRMCVVEVEGSDRLVTACDTEVTEGMAVRTNSPKARYARKMNLLMILSQHDSNCVYCVRSGSCELQRFSREMNVHAQPFKMEPPRAEIDARTPVIRNDSKCIKCMRCVQICDKVQGMNIWDVTGTGSRASVNVSFNRKLVDTDCTFCGQCVTHCPTGALTARDDTRQVIDAIEDPEITTVVQVAPAVRVAWSEALGLSKEEGSIERMAASLRAVGFDYVFDTNFGADLTIMEEASEFVERFTHRDRYKWPMFTSCCPGWVSFLKSQFPAYKDNLSTAKSPQQMFGAIAKTYFAQKIGVDPSKLFVVSIMPCSAKKHECAMESMRGETGAPDVDAVLTTREMCRLMMSEGIKPSMLEDEPLDSPLGTGTGAAVIFGATGGVMDAALRTAYKLAVGRAPDADAFEQVRGDDPWKAASFDVPGAGRVHVAVVSGLANARRLMQAIDDGDVRYDFVEVMACPGGCAGGGGQPIHDGVEMASERGCMLWDLDASAKIRYSHDNPEIIALYREYLKEPLGERSHRLLHTEHK